jgi:dephospho-CoA kinase
MSSDDVVRGLYEREDVRAQVGAAFGDGVLRPDGSVDRSALGRIVFADAARLRELEGILLPLLADEFERWRDRQERAGRRLLVHEAPTLFEAGIADRYDVVVTITAPEDVREARRPGARSRMTHQLPESEKAARSDHVYRNAGSLEELNAWVGDLVASLGGA